MINHCPGSIRKYVSLLLISSQLTADLSLNSWHLGALRHNMQTIQSEMDCNDEICLHSQSEVLHPNHVYLKYIEEIS